MKKVKARGDIFSHSNAKKLYAPNNATLDECELHGETFEGEKIYRCKYNNQYFFTVESKLIFQ